MDDLPENLNERKARHTTELQESLNRANELIELGRCTVSQAKDLRHLVDWALGVWLEVGSCLRPPRGSGARNQAAAAVLSYAINELEAGRDLGPVVRHVQLNDGTPLLTSGASVPEGRVN